jgi:hypothetical protein
MISVSGSDPQILELDLVLASTGNRNFYSEVSENARTSNFSDGDHLHTLFIWVVWTHFGAASLRECWSWWALTYWLNWSHDFELDKMWNLWHRK